MFLPLHPFDLLLIKIDVLDSLTIFHVLITYVVLLATLPDSVLGTLGAVLGDHFLLLFILMNYFTTSVVHPSIMNLGELSTKGTVHNRKIFLLKSNIVVCMMIT